MRKLVLTIFVCLFTIAAFAQVEKCGALMLRQSVLAKHPDFAARFDSVEATQKAQTDALLKARASGAMEKTTSIGTIPIIFHIVLNAAQIAQLGGEAGIQERADSEIAVLNRDYNAGNADANLIPAAFKPLYGNAGMTFGLARRTPSGGCSSGIDIVETQASSSSYYGTVGSMAGFSDVKYTASGGADMWDSSTYLNVWIVNPSPAGILGLTVPKSYANVGSGFSSSEEGTVINYAAFGSKSANIQYFLNSGCQGGRTLTHELGHFFEIWHPSGDDGGLCPWDNGGKDDGIADTPPEGINHQGSYTIPLPVVRDNCSDTANGILYMDFMDYPDDPFALLFTTEQAARMQSNVLPGGESYSLTTHPAVFDATGCPNLAVPVTAVQTIGISPNPTNGIIHINSGTATAQYIIVTNILGQVVQRIIPSAKATIYTIDMVGMQKGVYFVQCYFADSMVSGKIILQ